MQTKQSRYVQIEKTRKTAKYMRNLHHALVCTGGACLDNMCVQTKTYIRHIETCDFARGLNEGKCPLAGCNTTYVLIEHLRAHLRLSADQLPKCFQIEGDKDIIDIGQKDSLGSRRSNRSSSFDSTSSEDTNPSFSPNSICSSSSNFSNSSSSSDMFSPGMDSSSPSANCLLCRIAFASAEEEREILNMLGGGGSGSKEESAGAAAKRAERAAAAAAAGEGSGGSAGSGGDSSGAKSPTAVKLYSHWHHQVKDTCVCHIANLVPFNSQAPQSPVSMVDAGPGRGSKNFKKEHASHCTQSPSIHKRVEQQHGHAHAAAQSHAVYSTAGIDLDAAVASGVAAGAVAQGDKKQPQLVSLPLARDTHVQASDLDFEEVRLMFRQSMSSASVGVPCGGGNGGARSQSRKSRRERVIASTPGAAAEASVGNNSHSTPTPMPQNTAGTRTRKRCLSSQ